MKRWIIIVVIVGLVGWTIYDFVVDNDTEDFVIDNDIQGMEFEPEPGLEKGNLAPDFELETLDGETVKLSDFRGEKVLLNFWATWCPPCRAEMPDMQKYHENHEDGVILAVNLLETENSSKNVEKFIDEYGITFTVLSDETTTVGNMYNAQQLPTSYLIDSEGKIENIAIGPLNYEQMEQAFKNMD